MKSAFVKLESGSEITDFEYTQLTKELVLMAWFRFFVSLLSFITLSHSKCIFENIFTGFIVKTYCFKSLAFI